MSQPILGASPVTGDELRGALESVLGRRITRLERRPTPYRSSYAVEELELDVGDGRALRLAFKDLGPASVPAEARGAKPAFVSDPLREIGTYRDVLAPARLGTARYYGSVVDAPADRYWLFLEWVPGRQLWQIGDLAVWQAVARWLAEAHSRLAERAVPPAGGSRLLRYDAAWYRLWMERARAFAPDNRRVALAWLAERYESVVERLAVLPTTVIHGEFYASNVLVQGTDERRRVCPVDWEMAAVGPGLIDLAALTAGTWSEAERRSIAGAYRLALGSEAVWASSWETFWAALDCSRLHAAVQWLGWSDGWSPPPQHIHDWLGEALRLAERLGL